MTTTNQCEVVKTFLDHLTKADYDSGKDFMEKQRVSSACELPKLLVETLCDFALAQKNYSEMKFQPANNDGSGLKENENFLDYVYKTLLLNLGKIQFDINHSYVKEFVAALMRYIPIRIKLIELYRQLLETGSSSDDIDFGELQEFVDEIPSSTFRNPSPIDGILKILQFEHYCMKCLINCHFYLGHALYIESLLSMKKANDIFLLWENHYERKETNAYSIFAMKNTLPALVLWFKRFKNMTVSKFTLYFYEPLLEQSSFNEITTVCNEYNVDIFNKMQQLQNQSGARSLLLAYDTLVGPNQKGHGIWGPIEYVTDPLNRYKIVLNFPRTTPRADILESLLLENNKGDFSMNKTDLIVLENSAYLLIRMDLKITFVMCYDSKPKNEKKLKSDVNEFVSQIRCHNIFSVINRFKDQ